MSTVSESLLNGRFKSRWILFLIAMVMANAPIIAALPHAIQSEDHDDLEKDSLMDP